MRAAILTSLLLLVGCSKATPDVEPEGNAQDITAAGPDVGPTLVPGVAVSYRYSFRLPIAAVERTQEQHAAQCEALGPARCRIVGLEYHAGMGRSISGTLDLRLAPLIARAFAKQGTAAVVGNGGMLSDAEISSTEAGAKVKAADRADASLSGEEATIQAQLARPGLGGAERTQLEGRLQSLLDLRRGNAADREEAAASLASTPMLFSYQSGPVDPGFTDGPILGGLRDGWRNVVLGTGTLLTLVITLLPWAFGVGLLVWLWRRYGARLGLRDGPAE